MRRNELFTKLIYLLSDENQNFKNTIPKEIFDNIMSYKLLLSLDSLTLSDIEEYFVKHDIDINASDESRQGFLHYSLCHNELNEVIKYFVTKGVNINDQDLIGNTPLYYAALGKNIECIKILLDNGADANISNHKE